jgi:hypothetical protein
MRLKFPLSLLLAFICCGAGFAAAGEEEPIFAAAERGDLLRLQEILTNVLRP